MEKQINSSANGEYLKRLPLAEDPFTGSTGLIYALPCSLRQPPLATGLCPLSPSIAQSQAGPPLPLGHLVFFFFSPGLTPSLRLLEI